MQLEKVLVLMAALQQRCSQAALQLATFSEYLPLKQSNRKVIPTMDSELAPKSPPCLFDEVPPELISAILIQLARDEFSIPLILRFASTCRLARQLVLKDASVWLSLGTELDFRTMHVRSPKKLNLGKVNDVLVDLLAKLPDSYLGQLEVLGFDYCSKITREPLLKLVTKCKKLRVLSVAGCAGVVFEDESKLAEFLVKQASRGVTQMFIAGTGFKEGLATSPVTSTVLDRFQHQLMFRQPETSMIRYHKCSRPGCWLPLLKESQRAFENACPACGLVEPVCPEVSLGFDRMRCLIRCSDCSKRCSPCECSAADNPTSRTTPSFGAWCRNPLCSSFICNECCQITRSLQSEAIYCADCFAEMLHYGISEPMDLAMEPDFGYA